MDHNKIILEGFYIHARNEIIQPERYVSSTRYFWDKWVPELGPNLTIIIMQLRKRAYYNKKTGEKRDCSTLSLETLSKETGLSIRTIIRELNSNLGNIFIKRLQNYRYDNNLCKKVRDINSYQVALDDPIHSSDYDKLEMKGMDTEDIAADLNAKLALRSNLPVDNSPPKCQIGTHIYNGQIGTANVNTISDILNVNVGNVHLKTNSIKEKQIEDEEDDEIEYRHPLLDRILSITQDYKSIKYFNKLISACSESIIVNAIEDMQTYISSGRKVQNKGAFLTSRIKELRIKK